jgi:hypothetical protein
MWAVLAIVEGVFAGAAEGLDTTGQKIYAVTVQAPWLIPYEGELAWMIPAALIVLAIPAYWLSVFVEWPVVSRFVAPRERPKTFRVVAIANLASYLVLAVLFVVIARAGAMLKPLHLFEGITNWFIESVYAVARFIVGAH